MRKWLCIFIILLCAGCSSKLAYDNLDWLIYWYMDDYVELNDEQEALFDKKLNSWIAWHRNEELDKYQQQLKKLRQTVKDDALNREAIAWHLNKAKAHIDSVRDKLAPELSELASRLDEEQVIYLFAALERENKDEEEKIIERREDSVEERNEELTDKIEDEFEARLGDLTDQQEKIIARYASQFEPSGLHWIAYRREIQNAARRLFITREQNKNFVRDLTHLLTNPDDCRSDAYLTLREKNRQLNLDLATELAPTMTKRQKAHLLDTIDDWLEDIASLKQ